MLGIKICEICHYVYSEHEHMVICPHLRKQQIDEDHDQSIKFFFHKLWSRDVGRAGYRKEDWMELQQLLQARGIDV